jgi:thioester reductase-like protein
MTPATLVTGATGFLGREIVRTLLRREPACRVVVLARAADDAALALRRHAIVVGLHAQEERRLTAVRGDLTLRGCGMSSATREQLLEQIDRVVHVAATTAFGLPLGEARRRNVATTAAVLELCRAIRARGGSGRLDYVSTAFVAGMRVGAVGEDELFVGQRFRNTYEQSKCEAEMLCRRAQDDLPIAIHRPSIIVGRATNGESTSFKALYWPIELIVRFYRRWPAGLTRLVPLPLRAGCSVDIVPVDWVADAIATLMDRDDAAGRCFHLAAGPAGASTTAELVRIGCAHFGAPSIRFGHPPETLIRLGARGAPLLRRVAPGFARQAELFYPYTIANPTFDSTNARAAGLAPPPVAAYFSHILAYAAATDFGRRPMASTPAPRFQAVIDGDSPVYST